ncbi:hypothetical protein SAMN02982994_0197 [Azospirillum lipoferum]|nr:hypothetical protein SAMN02982994_0197 [Azospirillum lipoferum]
MAVRKPKDDGFQSGVAADSHGRSGSAPSPAPSFEPKPAAGKADFDERLAKVMGRIAKTRAYLAK